jgi:hypothetical protein
MKKVVLFFSLVWVAATVLSCNNCSNNAQKTTETKTDTLDLKGELNKYMTALINLDSINLTESFQTTEDISLYMAILTFADKFVIEGLMNNDAEIVSLAKELERLSSFQKKKDFPVVRKIFANLMTEGSGYAVHLEASGSGNRIITITSSKFVVGFEIEKYQQMAYEVLKMYRFKQVRYKWQRDNTEYTYYDLNVPADTAPILD